MIDIIQRFKQSKPILLDGATGTELDKRGVDIRLPLWSTRAIIQAPHILSQIHLDYLYAGAEVITANTFRTQERTLKRAGLEGQTREITLRAVQIAQQAVSFFQEDHALPRYVAGSLPPLEDCYSPQLVPSQQECIHEHSQAARNLADAGVDCILVETMNTIMEAEAAARAAQQTGLPFLVSFTCRTDGTILSGESLRKAIDQITPYSPLMIGINCTPLPTIHQPVRMLLEYSPLPVSVYANIGKTDDIDAWTITADASPEEYVDAFRNFIHPNIRLVGGCCGTTPEHISALGAFLDFSF